MEKNSLCKVGLYHNYRIVEDRRDGLVEICERCKNKQFFHINTPDSVYLSTHLRLSIQKRDPRYHREYES